jgi:hypothetical protein
MNARWAGSVGRSGRCKLKLGLVDRCAVGGSGLGPGFGLGLSAAAFADLLFWHGEFGS